MDRGLALPRATPFQLRSPKPIRELRDLMRYRRKLVESQAAERNRLLKVLENRQHQVGKRGHGRVGNVRPTMAIAGTSA